MQQRQRKKVGFPPPDGFFRLKQFTIGSESEKLLTKVLPYGN